MANIHDISDNTLKRVIIEGGDLEWNFFALKVMISRLKLKLVMTNNEVLISECCSDIRDLLIKSSNIPNAKKDLQLIVERFGTD